MKRRNVVRASGVLLALIFVLMSVLNQTVYAIDPLKGVEVNVSTTDLDQSAQAAVDSGLTVTKIATVDKGVAATDAEVAAKKAEIVNDYNQQIAILNQAKADMDAYNIAKAEYDILKAQYDLDLAQYNIDKAQYDADMVVFDAAMADLEVHKEDSGYLNPPLPQLLTFADEENASVSVPSTVTTYTADELLAEVESWGFTSGQGYDMFKGLNNQWGPGLFIGPNDLRLVLEKGVAVPVTYQNLEKSSYNGVELSRVVYTYTLKETEPLPDKVPVIIHSNPNKTIWYTDFFGKTSINMKVDFYDSNDQLINPENALLSFASLNRGHLTKGQYPEWDKAIEKVLNFTGEYVEINNSSIKAHPDGMYSDTNNGYRDEGSAYNTSEWDTADSPFAWYGAGVGKVAANPISFNIASEKVGVIWFAFDSKVKAKDIPTKPVEPIAPVEPVEPIKPNTEVSYHYDVFYVKSLNEKKALDELGNDISNSAVKVDSVVKFELNTSKLPAGHEEITSLLFKDTLPENYELNLDKTKQESPDYDVTYDVSTRLLTFTAKTDLLNTINGNLNVEAIIPSPMVVGKVTANEFRYENKFDLTIDGTYAVESNTVYVFTPGDPEKDVFKPSDPLTSIDGDYVKASDELLYKVTYLNVTGAVQNVIITDVIPTGTSYVDGSADNGGVFTNGKITWTKNVADGETFEVTFKVTVDDATKTPITNQAIVSEGNNQVTTNETSNPVIPAYKATHTFVSGTPGKTLPQAVKDLLPADQTGLVDGTAVNPTQPTETEVPADGGKWIFKGYDPQNATINGADVNFEGVWLFEEGVSTSYKATHTFVSGTPGKTLPQAVKDLLPADQTGLVDGTAVNPTQPTETEVPADGGKWIFKGYDPQNATINGADVNFEGVWLFEEDLNPKKDVFTATGTTSIDGANVEPADELVYKITYKNVTGSALNVSGGAVTAVITDEIPADTTYVDGSADNGGVFASGKITWTKDIAVGETFEVTFRVTVDSDAKDPITNQAVVSVGDNSVKTNITNNPIAKIYKATHTFISGTPGKTLPQAVKDLLPADQTGLADGTTVTPTQPTVTEVSVTGGKWVFKGYDPKNATINGADALFTGIWIFIEDDDNTNYDGGNGDGNNSGGGNDDNYVTQTKTYKLGNYVWEDTDKDGIQDPTEHGIKGVKVVLFDNAGNKIAETVSDINGRYIFTGLTNGKYSLQFSNLPDGYQATLTDVGVDTLDSDGLNANCTIDNADNTSVDFGVYKQVGLIAPVVVPVEPVEPIEPTKPELPHTNESFPVLPIGLGLLLIVAGAGVFIWNKRTEF